MDVQTIIAAAPFVKKAWKFTPAPLRVPLVLAGAAFVAWRYFGGKDRSDASQDTGQPTAIGSEPTT